MSGTTVTQGLTFPTGTDKLKDIPTWLKTLATQLDGKLQSHYLDLARTEVPPFALLNNATPASYTVTGGSSGSNILRFESVLVDTASMVDLTADNRVFNLTKPGHWCVGCYARINGPGGTSGVRLMLNTDFGNTWGNVAHHDTTNTFVWLSASAIFYTTLATDKFFVQISQFGTGIPGTALTVDRALAWAYWVRDL